MPPITARCPRRWGNPRRPPRAANAIVSRGAQLSLLNVSENATFLVTDPATGGAGRKSVLRVHRLGYHSQAAIESELAWMDALRAEAGIRTPRVLPASAGSRVVAVPSGGPHRHCVRFDFLPAAHPP